VRRLRPLALTAIAAASGAAIALAVAAAAGMPSHELLDLGIMLGPGLLLIVLVAWAVMGEDARRRERAIDAQRRDLVTAVSHDLRTPLASLRAMAEAVGDGMVRDPETLQLYVGEIRRCSETLTTLVDDLFELAQLESGEISLTAERAQLSEVVEGALAACDRLAVEKRLALETALDGAADVRCSPHLGRVLQNLLQNAIRHTPADGTVRVEARCAYGWLELAVEDSGEGIAKRDLPRVFEPFWRGDAARTAEGAGLGLAVSRRIVEALGGEISVRATSPRGARFEVAVPIDISG
jgi:signal transduction histidine kinase